MNSKLKNYGIILASGSGSRYGSDLPKQFVKINGKTILERTIEKFEKIEEINEITVVITPEYKSLGKDIIKKAGFKKVSKILNGGKLRKDSSCIGITSVNDKEANVLIHDCARPFVTERIIRDCINALDTYSAVGVGVPSTDTIIEVEDNIIKNIPPRKNLMRIQTPQCFRLSLIKKAHELSVNDTEFTDDCGLIIKHNLAKIFIVEGDRNNFKITYPEDIYLAEKLC